MAKSNSFLESGLDRMSLARWTSRAQSAETTPRSKLRGLSDRARSLRMQLDRFLNAADDRLTIPRVGSDAFQKERGTDWAWRADAWRWRSEKAGAAAVENGDWIGPGLRVFHDCSSSEITSRQLRNSSAEDLAPFAMRLDVFAFDGSFLSVALDLPEDAAKGLRKSHLVKLKMWVETERDMEIFARLNVQHGPNTEQIVREIPKGAQEASIEFDMDVANLNEKRIEGMWLDLIFDNPAMTQVTVRDLTMSRSPRAEL